MNYFSCWVEQEDVMLGDAAYMLSMQTTLQQVSWLVVLQVADTGITSSAQQQLQDVFLVWVSMETSCHV